MRLIFSFRAKYKIHERKDKLHSNPLVHGPRLQREIRLSTWIACLPILHVVKYMLGGVASAKEASRRCIPCFLTRNSSRSPLTPSLRRRPGSLASAAAAGDGIRC